MTKNAALSIRVPEELKRAVERAAKEDDRSVASYIERVLASHLTTQGYYQA